jgi:hypothetical protein
MKAEQLWKELHYLFDTDDGSLPEILIANLSKDEVVAIFDYLQQTCRQMNDAATFWSIEEQADRPVVSVPNAAALVMQGRAEPFIVLCEGLAYDGEVIPDIGVFVFGDEIALVYRMGREWNAANLKALFGILQAVTRIAPTAKISVEEGALKSVRRHFEATWKKYVQATGNV